MSAFPEPTRTITAQSKKKVVYYYDSEVGNFYYGANHPMKPHRIRMTHSLVVNYGLFKKMEIYRPFRLTERDMTLFHADDYCHFLKMVTPENEVTWGTDLEKYNIDIDCPVFDGLYRFCQISSGGSVGGAYKLNHHSANVAINWAGGLHHAKKSEASGFCYINDIVLAILELLKYNNRVLYVDIDIHHGDGVEEAFYTTDRVMCVSFHKYGDFFPGTGAIEDRGVLKGENYSINVPLKEGMNDSSFEYVFKPIIKKVIDFYQPGAIVMQLGADSLAGDRLGCFNLTIAGHGECLRYVLDFGLPTLTLGGGGYTLRNVARCWTYETSLCSNTILDNKLPYNEYYEYFAPDHLLATMPTNMININTQSDLQNILKTISEYLKNLTCSPSQPIQMDGNRKDISRKSLTPNYKKIVKNLQNTLDKEILLQNEKEIILLENDKNIDIRMTSIVKDKMIVDQREFFDDEKDNDIINDDHSNKNKNKNNNNDNDIEINNHNNNHNIANGNHLNVNDCDKDNNHNGMNHINDNNKNDENDHENDNVNENDNITEMKTMAVNINENEMVDNDTDNDNDNPIEIEEDEDNDIDMMGNNNNNNHENENENENENEVKTQKLNLNENEIEIENHLQPNVQNVLNMNGNQNEDDNNINNHNTNNNMIVDHHNENNNNQLNTNSDNQ